MAPPKSPKPVVAGKPAPINTTGPASITRPPIHNTSAPAPSVTQDNGGEGSADTSANTLPAWKQALLKKKEEERIASEAEEMALAAASAPPKDMPAWKVAIMKDKVRVDGRKG